MELLKDVMLLLFLGFLGVCSLVIFTLLWWALS